MQVEIHKTYPVYSCPTAEIHVFRGTISDEQIFEMCLSREEIVLLCDEIEEELYGD